MNSANQKNTRVKRLWRLLTQPRSLNAYIAFSIIIFAIWVGPIILSSYVQENVVASQRTAPDPEKPNATVINPELGALHEAIRTNNFLLVNKLISKGVDVNHRESRDDNAGSNNQGAGATPLIVAVYGEYPNDRDGRAIVRVLLRAGADVDVVDSLGRSPLAGACIRGTGFHLLLKASADPLMSTAGGSNVLVDCAQRAGKMLAALVDYTGSDISEENLNQVLVYLLNYCAQEYPKAGLVYVPHWDPIFNVIKSVIAAGADANQTNENGEPLVAMAARTCSDDVVTALIDADANVDAHSEKHEAAVWSALRENLRSNFKVLVKGGADLEVLNKEGETMVTHLVRTWANPGKKGNTSRYLRQLLSSGADPDGMGKNHMTPLIIAIKQEYYKVAQLLLLSGADPNKRGIKGDLSFNLALKKGDQALVREFISSGANPLNKGADGLNAFDIVKAFSKPAEIKAELDQWKERQERKQNTHRRIQLPVLTREAFGTALRQIPRVIKNDPENAEKRIKTLLEAGANINKMDSIGRSALAIACSTGNRQLLKFLLKRGADPNHRSRYGVTALMHCASSGRPLLTALLAAGADASHRDHYGWGAMEYAVSGCTGTQDDVSNIRALYNNGAVLSRLASDQSLLVHSIIRSYPDRLNRVRCHKDIFKIFVQAGLDVTREGVKGTEAVMEAISRDMADAVEVLLDAGAILPEIYQESPLLLWAVINRSETTVHLLIDYADDVNVTNSYKKTALMLAAEKGSIGIVRHLINAGANVGRIDRGRNTALTYAIKFNHSDVVQLLEKSGAKPERTRP